MKTLALLTLLATTSCAAVVPLAAGTFAVHRGSTAINEYQTGEVGTTLTEHDYNACKEGDEAACNRCFGYSVFLGAFHCTMWHPVQNALPTISEKRDDYGGADYYAFIEKGR